MAKERSPNRKIAKQMRVDSGGKMLLKDIAVVLSLGESQIRKWKSQDKSSKSIFPVFLLGLVVLS
ncbi:phage terminase small subunit-related protein [Paenibacillus sp. PL2-23]|uniref:phage terminase small subunit-related protein n=1 Tax=Paenibacillus sp. PL2-23 TaxID=2100729 RepID=UPI0030F91B55